MVGQAEPSQKEVLLQHLRTHGSITKLDALQLYGIMNTGGRIHELQRDGHPVLSRMVDTHSGKRVAEYYIVNFDDKGQGALW